MDSTTHILEMESQSEMRGFTHLNLTQLISSSCSHADKNRVHEPVVASFQLCPCKDLWMLWSFDELHLIYRDHGEGL